MDQNPRVLSANTLGVTRSSLGGWYVHPRKMIGEILERQRQNWEKRKERGEKEEKEGKGKRWERKEKG